MTEKIKRFAMNTAGADYVVGDVHGCFSRLQAELDKIGFNQECDRLFSVGDLVDRGPESELALEWLDKPWFHAVRGNHEQMAIDHCARMSDAGIYAANGGAWMIGKTRAEGQPFADAFAALPIAIELETTAGLIGIVHADCPVPDWNLLSVALTGKHGEAFEQMCIWSRERASNHIATPVENVKAVIVGHTPMREPTWLGNVLYIDTGAVFGREITIAKIQ
jgi:serine/threonine protein phosphatase 1